MEKPDTENARLSRYVEAIGLSEGITPGTDPWHADAARAVMAVADAEQDALRAEVERQAAIYGVWNGTQNVNWLRLQIRERWPELGRALDALRATKPSARAEDIGATEDSLFVQRIRLVMEDVETSDGRIIQPRALTWRHPIPVTEHRDGYSTVIGSIGEVRREDDGSITGVTNVTGTLTAYVDHVEWDEHEPGVMTKGRLAGMSRVHHDGWPWLEHPQRGWDATP